MSRIDPAWFDSPLVYHRAGQANALTHLKHTLYQIAQHFFKEIDDEHENTE